jgi:hypothetical protein
MYLALGINAISTALRWYADGLGPSASTELSINALNLVFFVLFIWLTARRRKNWARWILLLVFIFSTVGYIKILKLLLPYWRTHGPDAFALGLALRIPIELAAFILIFTGNARGWFEQPPAGVISTEQSVSP